MDSLTVKFLENAANLLKKAKSSENIGSVINQLRLKSLDFSKCAPNEINRSEICMDCGNVWRDGLYSLHVKCHKNKKIKKQIRKIDDITKLSSCTKDFLSYYKSQKDNILIMKCLVCKSITKYCMRKPFTKVNKGNISLQCVEKQNSMSRKRKRKGGKNQSFAGLSATAVLQARARLGSSESKVEDTHLQAKDSKICESTDVKNLSASRLVKNNPFPDKTILQTASQSDLSLGICRSNVKNQKLKNHSITVTTKKSSKKKKKSFLSEVLSFL